MPSFRLTPGDVRFVIGYRTKPSSRRHRSFVPLAGENEVMLRTAFQFSHDALPQLYTPTAQEYFVHSRWRAFQWPTNPAKIDFGQCSFSVAHIDPEAPFFNAS